MPDDVDGALYALRHAVSDLIEYRHGTLADRVMQERDAIHAAAAELQNLLRDLNLAGITT
jgi:hypothetical protein